MGDLLLRLKTWWETADRTQRFVAVFGGSFLTLLLAGTFYFASRPKMTMLYGGLTPQDAGSVVAEVQKLGVPVESDLQGNVFVPSSNMAEVQAKLAVSGKTPASGHIGNEELSKFNAFMPPSVERERLKVLLEGELARTIETIEGVGGARVHITFGEQSPFASDKKPASASIMLQENAGGAIGSEQARAIALMVSRSTTGLTPDNVLVMDSTGRALFDGSTNSTLTSQANERVASETAESQRRERDLQAMFDSTFGRGATMVKVNLSMDFDKETQRSTKVAPKDKPLVQESANENLGGSAATGSGPSGVTTNTPLNQNQVASNTSKNNYNGEKKYTEFPADKIETETEKAVGSISTMSISVLVNSDKIQNSAPVQEFLNNYVKANPGATASVTSAKFDTTATTEAQQAAVTSQNQDRLQQLFSLLPIAALILVGGLVARSVAKAARAQNLAIASLPAPSAGPAPEPLDQLRQLASDKPEAIAAMMRNWMAEEGR